MTEKPHRTNNDLHHSLESMADEILKISKVAYSLSLRLTWNKADAQDLIQEASFIALNKRDKFTMNTNFKAWFLTIIRNNFRDSYRKRVRKNKIINSQVQIDLLVDRSDNSSENDPHQKIQYDYIESIKNWLKDNFSVPFMLYYEGYSYQEIVELLNLPMWTVKSNIFYARKEMKKLLSDEYPNRSKNKFTPIDKPKENP